MKPFFLIFANLFIIFGLYFSFLPKEKITLSFTPKSTLVIRGESNVHKFSCDFNTYELTDSLKVNFKKHTNVIVFENTQLLLEKAEFDCGGNGINKDFHKLLQTKDFPYIKMNLKKVDVSNKNNVKADVSFTICDITREYSVPITVVHHNNKMTFKGSISLSISDFNLISPKKVFGLIKVKDEIVVDINLESVLNKKTP